MLSCTLFQNIIQIQFNSNNESMKHVIYEDETKLKKVKFEFTLGPPFSPLPHLSQSQYHHHLLLLKQSLTLTECWNQVP